MARKLLKIIVDVFVVTFELINLLSLAGLTKQITGPLSFLSIFGTPNLPNIFPLILALLIPSIVLSEISDRSNSVKVDVKANMEAFKAGVPPENIIAMYEPAYEYGI